MTLIENCFILKSAPVVRFDLTNLDSVRETYGVVSHCFITSFHDQVLNALE